MIVHRALLLVAATVAVVVAISPVAPAAPNYAVNDDDAAWIVGTVPGSWAQRSSAPREERVHGAHAFRRASAWMALFLGCLLARDSGIIQPRRPFDLDTFALELVLRLPLPATLPRAVGAEVPF